ncbi:hypothetical protein BDW22DRAFT_1298219, partial [Trametopsis cervina]
LVKIVNGLTAKAESPGPMTCALLLGQPDHYTPETFRVFYWWPFSKHVEETAPCLAQAPDTQSNQEKVVLSYSQGRIVGRNQIQDYTYRPTALQHCSLYEFMCTTVVKKITKTHHNFENMDETEPDPTDLHNSEYIEHDVEDNDSDDDSPEDLVPHGSFYHRFQIEHPLHATHGVFISRGRRVLLNFVGGTLPRRDRGDNEAFCRVMLTMFSPKGWRSGLDLNPDSRTWREVFDSTTFEPTHMEIMDNMNLLYECYDAKHDWAA